MNKQDITVVALLFAALLAWMFFQRPETPPGQQAAGTETAAPSETPPAEAPAEVAQPAEPVEAPAIAAPETTEPVASAVPFPALPASADGPVRTVVLSNSLQRVTLDTENASVRSVELPSYRRTIEEDSGPVIMDFSLMPALALVGDGAAWLAAGDDNVAIDADNSGATVRGLLGPGIVVERRIKLGDGYAIDVEDTFSNRGDAPAIIPDYEISLGPVKMIESKAKVRGISYLGIDTLAAEGGEKVKYWGKAFPKLYGYKSSPFSCAGADVSSLPSTIVHRVDYAVDWAAAKNKFFVQILDPETAAQACNLYIARNPDSPGFVVSTVAAAVQMRGEALEPGETMTRRMRYYCGPKKHARLKKLGHHQGAVMQFGWLRWLCEKLLWTLNAIHAVVRNYGLAIIVLTAIVRVIFWPITHKSTESMKKMQKLQPLVQEVRTKYKDKPQKMNQEVMELYRQHKVNPMAGCLPIVVQIPVFIALFTVLRSAVELRFAGFLWISDLSEPEGILRNVLPIPLNILPLFMTVTMVLQQRLTPTAGDPQQQKMMMIMPVVMLVILYNMPSALVLYWSTSQCFSIAQLLIQRARSTDEPLPATTGKGNK